MAMPFRGSPRLTLGVELELQLANAETRDLTSASPQIFELLGGPTERIKPEIFQSMIEIATGICEDVEEAQAQLEESVGFLRGPTDSLGVQLLSAGCHPFARYTERVIFPAARYEELIDRNRWVARRLAIFGLHVHVGVADGDTAIRLMNALLPYLPCVLALSASSPYWQGQDTGLASSRATIFEAMPTAGHPRTFASWRDFEESFEIMRRAGAVRGVKDLWWDLRPQPELGTLEIRICDAPSTLDELGAIVGFVHALCAWLLERQPNPGALGPTANWIARENKWRALREGLEAELIFDTDGSTGAVRQLIAGLLREVQPHAERLGAETSMQRLRRMLRGPGSYARQRAVAASAGTLDAVVDHLAMELRSGLR